MADRILQNLMLWQAIKSVLKNHIFDGNSLRFINSIEVFLRTHRNHDCLLSGSH